MYKWTSDSIRFRIDAAEYTRFDEGIAEKILPRLHAHDYVCDAGCGLGYLSLALAKGCRRVAAIDVNANALAVLKDNISRMGVQNIDVLYGDLFSMQKDPKYDAMVFCFFGRVEQTLITAKAQCSGKVLLIKKNWETHRFTLKETPLEGFTFHKTRKELDVHHIPYKSETFFIEMGQPFKTLEDAKLFFETYRMEDDDTPVAQEHVEARLLNTASPPFMYYLPIKRSLGLIEIDVDDIPNG